jgi:surface antigen
MSMASKAIVPLAAAMLLFVSLPAEAQFLGPGVRTNIELTKHDLAIMRGLVNAKIHGRSVGATASWSNPDSGNYGTMTLVRKYSVNGRPCESIGYTLATRKMPVAPEHYRLNSCLQPDGQWRISS